jgi:hypothetical protein
MDNIDKQQLEAIDEIIQNMKSVKGESFTKMVRFVGLVQSYTKMNIEMLIHAKVPEEEMDLYSERAALFSCSLCAAYGGALNIEHDDLAEVLKMVDQVEERIAKVFTK